MKKLIWSEPQIAEIEVKITRDFNKVGFNDDLYTQATNGELQGDICPAGSCGS